jgi:hypothetical protein
MCLQGPRPFTGPSVGHVGAAAYPTLEPVRCEAWRKVSPGMGRVRPGARPAR